MPAEEMHPMFKDLLTRTDGWTDNVNESSLDYNFMTRHPTMSIVFVCLTSVGVIAGNIGNVLVIGAVLSYRRLLRNTGNLFIVNLAIADLCITAIISPMNMTGVTRGPRFFLDKVFLCSLLGSICTVSCIVSMWSIAAVAVNRVICICKFFLYRTIYSRRKTICYCIGLWLMAILFDLPNWIGWGGHTFGLKEMGCTFDRTANHNYTIFLATVAITIPMVIVLTSYTAVYWYVHKTRSMLRKVSGRKHGTVKGKLLVTSDQSNHAVKKEDLQLAFTLFLTFLVFTVCWSPYMIAIVFDFEDRWPKEVYVAATLLGHSNSCLNSVIYAMCNKRFRQGYYVFIHKLLCMEIKDEKILQDSRKGTMALRFKSKCIDDKTSPSPSVTMVSRSPIRTRSPLIRNGNIRRNSLHV